MCIYIIYVYVSIAIADQMSDQIDWLYKEPRGWDA